MSTKFKWNASLAMGALSLATMFGCVADRPARNGVFNENQYVRKDFLVRAGDDTNPDSGWFLKATIVQASEPNVFGDSSIFGLYSGSHSQGDLMHFVVTSDKLQMVSNREISTDPTVGTEPEVINAWPAVNVDLKYQVNLDGETTNFYQENQELDWEVRQWVKLSFDKNDLSDLSPLGSYFVQNVTNCADTVNSSVTLVPDSFIVDEVHDYMEWSVQVTMPIAWTTSGTGNGNITNCIEAFGPMGVAANAIGRQNETVTLKYSMTRAVAAPTYAPMVIAEKDPIQRKYGPLQYISENRDPSTGLLAANAYVIRYDPTQPIDWYFEEGFPTQYMGYFTNNTAVLSPMGASPIPGLQTTIEDGTNALLVKSGAKARVAFHQYNAPMSDGSAINRTFGDVRWNMLRWLESEDQQNFFAGVTSPVVDPRTGQNMSTDIVFENFAIKDYYVETIDAYLQSIGMSPPGSTPFDQVPWSTTLEADGVTPLPACTSGNIGATVPIIPATVVANHNGNSTLFQKIQQYLYKPSNEYGPLGPQNFIATHVRPDGSPDTDFYSAYYAYLPYIVYADPLANPFVTPDSSDLNLPAAASSSMWSQINQEGQLHDLEAQLDQGQPPYNISGSTGEADARTFLDTYKTLTENHRALQYNRGEMGFRSGVGNTQARADAVDAFSMVSVIQKDARHCVNVSEAPGAPTTPHWESKVEWINSLVSSYWSQVFWHEFGHAMGLEHNFMASVDQPNFPASNGTNADGSTRYPLYASSVMEYNAAPDRIFWTQGWAPYDAGAITWIYANLNGNPANVPKAPATPPASIGASGQQSATYPWIDPNGYTAAGVETQFLYCNEKHTKYTPLCRAGDLGTTPSEITANDIDMYEWQYQFRNFRLYHKIDDFSHYGDTPMNFITEARRFLSLWAYDWSSGELTQRFVQIGVLPPSTAVEAQTYYDQLSKSFANEISSSAQLSAALHEAIVQQSAGARPYLTTFDNYFGDVTQQGIILDKVDAIQSFTALWPVDNYDQTQAQGQFITSYAGFGVSQYADETSIGSLYQTVAEQALTSMLGGSFDAFEYAKPLAVAQFTFDTHDPNYLYENAAPARPEAMEWAGGYQFNRLQDFLEFFQNIAVQNAFSVVSEGGTTVDCTTMDTCNYDPRTPQGYPQDTFFSNNYNQFLGPDGRRWIWAYLQDRNQYVACDQDRNIATYVQMLTYTTDVIFGQDDGNVGPAFADELNINYTLDYYYEALQQTPQ